MGGATRPCPALPALRVLYLSWRDRDNPEAGGAETFTERTAEVMTMLGHEVTLVTSSFPGAAADERHGLVRVVRRGNRFTCYLHGLAHLARRRGDYDVVVDVQNGVPFFTPLVSRVPVVLVVHHLHREQWSVVFGRVLGPVGWLLESRLAPRVYRRCRYVTVSQATRAELATVGVGPARVDLVYSGNDRPPGLDEGPAAARSAHPSLCVVGRLVPHKQVETAIDLVADLGAAHPGLSLDVVGAGYWMEPLQEHARRRGVSDRVVFHGFVEEETKHEVLARSWVLVVPSHKEGWGLTIVEAGLHGTPAVAYAYAGGPSESVLHGRTGLLARDTPELAHQVDQLLRRPALRAHLGTQAQEHARNFDWSVTGARLVETLRSVLGQGPRPHQDAIGDCPLVPVEELEPREDAVTGDRGRGAGRAPQPS